MGKVLPVPSINGLDELLAIVSNDTKVAKYLREMKKLRDSIVKNLEAYTKHDTADQRLREADVMHKTILKIQEDNCEEKLRMDKSFQRRNKAAKKREDEVEASEKLAYEQWEILVDMELEHSKEVADFRSRSEIFEKESRAIKLHIDEDKTKLIKREDKLALKFQKLSELFD